MKMQKREKEKKWVGWLSDPSRLTLDQKKKRGEEAIAAAPDCRNRSKKRENQRENSLVPRNPNLLELFTGK